MVTQQGSARWPASPPEFLPFGDCCRYSVDLHVIRQQPAHEVSAPCTPDGLGAHNRAGWIANGNRAQAAPGTRTHAHTHARTHARTHALTHTTHNTRHTTHDTRYMTHLGHPGEPRGLKRRLTLEHPPRWKSDSKVESPVHRLLLTHLFRHRTLAPLMPALWRFLHVIKYCGSLDK